MLRAPKVWVRLGIKCGAARENFRARQRMFSACGAVHASEKAIVNSHLSHSNMPQVLWAAQRAGIIPAPGWGAQKQARVYRRSRCRAALLHSLLVPIAQFRLQLLDLWHHILNRTHQTVEVLFT